MSKRKIRSISGVDPKLELEAAETGAFQSFGNHACSFVRGPKHGLIMHRQPALKPVAADSETSKARR
jgi:hypothetical protein